MKTTLYNLGEKVRRYINRLKFNRSLRLILLTKPIHTGNDAFTVLSMVHHRDVDSYLLAIKSFCRYFEPRQIVVVADPTINTSDRARIESHLIGVTIVEAEHYRHPELPQGGCWERLIAISNFVQNDYVIQLDADTVTISDMGEVRRAIVESRSFVLATEDGQDFVSCVEAARWAKLQAISGGHVQLHAEAQLDRIPDASSKKYVRGCAGFSGFAPRSFNLEKLREFSDSMKKALGARWSAWGTEQFTSNYMVSNSPISRVLPHPKYCHPGREVPETVFLHFVGFVRFDTDRYAKVARDVWSFLK